MKSIIINKNDAGQRLDRFLQKLCPALPLALLYKYIRLKRVKLNGKRAEISARLKIGDVLDCYINDEFFSQPGQGRGALDFLSAGKTLNIVYEDEHILLADKPQGLLAHPDDEEFGDTLIGRIKRYLYEKNEYHPGNEQSFTPALCNRIDRNTGGLVIAAKTAEALRVLNEKIKAREVNKFYLCVVHGKPEKKSDTLHGRLFKEESKNKVYVSKFGRQERRSGLRSQASNLNGEEKEIVTRYRVLKERDNLSLLEVELLTGRTHQIRAHLASIGHPLLGDGKYGVNAADRKRGFKHQALYSYKLEFMFKSDAGALEYLNGRSFEVKNVWFRGLLD
ncbi:MAG: RluA family pseudouridine synthase [Oscillospiraceae bacterium]|jgi:23S rRNA pseudouridine955/2504/2580 synthase|nr:RluA family pseudouridine synthase [Oscillospiraceae bacterium]